MGEGWGQVAANLARLPSKRYGVSRTFHFFSLSLPILSFLFSLRTPHLTVFSFGMAESSGLTVVFDAVKNAEFTLDAGLRVLQRKLRNVFKFDTNKEDISVESLSRGQIYVFCGPQAKFSVSEFTSIRQYLERGGSVLFCLGESHDKHNVNYLTEEFGIACNTDAVIRTVYRNPHFHPREVAVTNGIVNREINRAAGFTSSSTARRDGAASGSLSFLLPYGSSLTVQKPAIPLLSTGQLAYPLNRPVCAAYVGSGPKSGRMVVLSSSKILSDPFFDAEQNARLVEILLHFLGHSKDIRLNAIDADDPDINDYNYLPDVGALAETLKSCFQEGDSVTADFSTLFNDQLFRLHTDLIPPVVNAYKTLDVDHKPLTLIPPEFEMPLPALQPAVFAPEMREPPPPALDLFDLDEQFASERFRLAQLTNKCADTDVDYYVRECGEILGLTAELPEDKKDAKSILALLLRQLVQYKKLNAEPAIRTNTPADGEAEYFNHSGAAYGSPDTYVSGQ